MVFMAHGASLGRSLLGQSEGRTVIDKTIPEEGSQKQLYSTLPFIVCHSTTLV